MTQKTRNIIGWVLTGMLGLAFIGSGLMKVMGSEEAMKGAATFGISEIAIKLLGVVEILAFVLFIIPRTGIVGTLLMVAYMGGAIATHLQHQMPIFAPIIIECLIWITAAIRFQELTKMLMSRK
ncbi:MAG: DoxX family protein [Bacteroidetes bacterium]|nr:DoxX family protein [Bacteroidota bacterium]